MMCEKRGQVIDEWQYTSVRYVEAR